MELSAEFPVYRRSIAVESGEGAWLTAEDGTRMLDLYAGHAVASLGYGDSRIVDTLSQAASQLFFQSNAVEVASRTKAVRDLGDFVGDGAWDVLLVNSGAEANENALRLALRHTGHPCIAAVRGAFHGRTAAAAAVTDGSESWYGFPQTPFEVRWIEFDHAETAEVIDESVAAVIVEPVQGVAGARVVSPALLGAIQERADACGCLVIADEVQSGMGRTGQPCAYQGSPLRPDMITLGKGIAAGFPAGALLARKSLVEGVTVGQFGTTFGGGPMAGALISEVCSRLRSPGFLENVARIGKRLACETIGKRVISASGKGLLMGLRVHGSARDLQNDLLKAGIMVGDAKDPQVVRLLPPLILNDSHVDRFLEALKEVGN